jgi:two-component system response regulator DevR
MSLSCARRNGRGDVAPAAPVRVAVVDGHVLFRHGLRALLQTEPALALVDEAGSPAGAVAAVARSRPDVVILDIRLDAGTDNGIELCHRLAATYPESRILVLTSALTDWLMVACLRAGARGILVKDSDFESLTQAILDIKSGRSGFDSTTAALAAGLLRRDGAKRALLLLCGSVRGRCAGCGAAPPRSVG